MREEAAKRLEANLIKAVDDHLKVLLAEKGTEEAWAFFGDGSFALLPPIQKYKDTFKHAKIAQELDLQATQTDLNASADLWVPSYNKATTALVEVWSLDYPTLDKFWPDLVEKCKSFEEMVCTAIRDKIVHAEELIQVVSETVDQYRTAYHHVT